jgi:hypothetical protein
MCRKVESKATPVETAFEIPNRYSDKPAAKIKPHLAGR